MKTNIAIKLSVILLLGVLILLGGTGSKLFSERSQHLGKVISEIKFIGNLNTSKEDILSFIEMRKGAVLTEKLLNNDLKALFATGYFYNIDIKADTSPTGVIVIFELKERPRVEEIEFIGADEIFPSDLRDKMPIKENEVITPEKVNATREVILKKYRDEGFFHAYVKFEMGKINPKTNLVKVKFIIDEGDEIPVSKINIIGTKAVDPGEIIGFLDMKEAGLIESGHFKEASFESDKQKIVAYLKSKGYLDADIVPEGTNWEIRWENSRLKDKRVIIVNYKIKEGDIYYFNGYEAKHDYTLDERGMPLFLNKENNPEGTPKENLKPIYTIKQLEDLFEFSNDDVGDIFDEGKFQRDKALINELYSSKGYLYVQVMPKRKNIELTHENLLNYENCVGFTKAACEEENKKLNIPKLRKILTKNPTYSGRKFEHVDFTIRENFLAYIENIVIKGNKKTLDKVIRREVLIKPGELFNSALVNRSRERIFNLGYFKEVNFNTRPGSSETKMNLIIDVVEQPTGTISMGGGYGTISGFSIFTELGENNLNGTGQKVSGRIEFGPLRKFFQLSWTEPWIYDKPWSLTLSMFYSSRIINVGAASITDSASQSIKERASYETSGVGFSVGLGHRLSFNGLLSNWTHFHRYSPSFFRSSNATSLVDDSIRAQQDRGWQFRSQITNGMGYDSRDNIFNPTSGINTYFSVSNTGQFLGGQSHFDQFNPVIEFYYTWFDYTLGGLIRSNALRRWKVVQEFRTSSVFTYERVPKYNRPESFLRESERQRNPYILQQDLQFIGGYESLRGWFFQDANYPREWQNGANHRVLFSSELRFPIEPSLLWLVLFFDSGSMYEEVSKWSGTRKENAEAFDQLVQNQRWNPNLEQALGSYLTEHYAPGSLKPRAESLYDLNNPGRLTLSSTNLAIDRFRYSWGFGLRIQIPVLPLRLYMAQKLRYTGDPGHPFTAYEDSKNFQFVFGIGDIRF
ncbi:MAG: BamA/TamA family outer membrane protein [Leptospiraceae bacterium]|nr:BamA/TamA family outer membrane protein [Leptospiraceae bacterium]